ncbi:MAG TPA: 1-(5-phosphoribosyl)-5-[(5-phosphoribosylamino)methylideneamino]imidazole-4-carboxamide isomerase [Methanocorpusculum sp.]|nr:1-(5-phosphoribosyl)-5-[(5-phosphoribosylamino)methylideneamino]imidazole-4-carboxamide isomerase [Methanocorpusculum sp.]
MDVFPAIDILGGRCVQLVHGNKSTSTDYGDPHKWVNHWIDSGAHNLHIINLDGAFNASKINVELIQLIIETTDVFIELGGGIRSIDDARGWLDSGVDRIILSTFAVQNPESIQQLSHEYGSERIMVGVDASNGEMVISGWQQSAGNYLKWAEKFEDLGAGSLLYTNVDVEGMQLGIRTESIESLLSTVSIPIIVAGGVSSISDIEKLIKLKVDGFVLGSALYSGKINIHEALIKAGIYDTCR